MSTDRIGLGTLARLLCYGNCNCNWNPNCPPCLPLHSSVLSASTCMCANVWVSACACVYIRSPTVPSLWRHAKCMCIVCFANWPPPVPPRLIGRSTQSTAFPAPPSAVIDLFGLSYTRVKLTINGVKLISHCLPQSSPLPLFTFQNYSLPCFSHFPANLCDLMRPSQPSVACLTVSLTVCLCLCALFINK